MAHAHLSSRALSTPVAAKAAASKRSSGRAAAVAPVRAAADTKDFKATMGFSGFAPELINGRLAQLGFVGALVAEVLTGETFADQFTEHQIPMAIAAAVVSIASFAPSVFTKGDYTADPETMRPKDMVGPFNKDAEKANSRAAMVGIVALLAVETFMGHPLITSHNRAVGGPTAENDLLTVNALVKSADLDETMSAMEAAPLSIAAHELNDGLEGPAPNTVKFIADPPAAAPAVAAAAATPAAAPAAAAPAAAEPATAYRAAAEADLAQGDSAAMYEAAQETVASGALSTPLDRLDMLGNPIVEESSATEEAPAAAAVAATAVLGAAAVNGAVEIAQSMTEQ